MAENENQVDIIHELVQLHHDRVALYHDAILALVHGGHLDIKTIFGELIRESLECLQQLNTNLGQLNGKAHAPDREYKGAVYQAWIGAKPPLQGDSSKEILAACEREIEAVQQAYGTALSLAGSMDDIVRLRINMQMTQFRGIGNGIREYHDAL